VKKRILVIIVLCLCFLGISSVKAKTYTIDDYIANLNSKSFNNYIDEINSYQLFSPEFEFLKGDYSVNYNENTGIITLKNTNDNDYTFEIYYNKTTDKISGSYNETSNDYKMNNSKFLTIVLYSLFDMHGYEGFPDNFLFESESFERYGISCNLEKFVPNGFGDGDESITWSTPTSLEFTLNGMEDAPKQEQNVTTTTKQNDVSTVKSTSTVNPKTSDINVSSLIVIAGMLIGVITVSFGRLKKVNR